MNFNTEELVLCTYNSPLTSKEDAPLYPDVNLLSLREKQIKIKHERYGEKEPNSSSRHV